MDAPLPSPLPSDRMALEHWLCNRMQAGYVEWKAAQHHCDAPSTDGRLARARAVALMERYIDMLKQFNALVLWGEMPPTDVLAQWQAQQGEPSC